MQNWMPLSSYISSKRMYINIVPDIYSNSMEHEPVEVNQMLVEEYPFVGTLKTQLKSEPTVLTDL